MERFVNRDEAGMILSQKLTDFVNDNTIVLAIPRGGVPVGYMIARKFDIPLDIILVKKIGHPGNREFAIGAVSLDTFFIEEEYRNIDEKYIGEEVDRIRKSLREKYRSYLGNRRPLSLKGKVVILVDDGIATGNTVLAGINILRKSSPAKIIVATPVIPYDNIEVIRKAADELVYLDAPKSFPGVGSFYDEFEQLSDDDVLAILNKAKFKNTQQRNNKVKEPW